MKHRHQYTIPELAAEENMSIEDTAQMVYDLCYIGLLEYCNKPGEEDKCQLPVFAPGSMESTVMTKERTDKYPETAPAFLNYVLDLQKKITWGGYMGVALMRAIPVEKAIENETRKVDWEEISYWLDWHRRRPLRMPETPRHVRRRYRGPRRRMVHQPR